MGATLLSLLLTSTVITASPGVSLQGILTNAAGLAVDGSYTMSIALYDAPEGGNVVWPENGGLFNATFEAKNGVFTVSLPDITPNTIATGDLWFGFNVVGEPELPRVPMQPVPSSLRASVAADLQCTGCITDQHLAFEVAKKADLAAVATSGAYGDLSGTPNLAPYAMSADLADVATSGAYGDLSGTPDLAPYAMSTDLAAVATSGAYGDLSGTPDLSPYQKSADLAAVATSSAYTDLSGTPDLAPYQKSADLAAVATSGAYTDLSGTPDLGPYAKSADLSVYAQTADLAPYARVDQSNSFQGTQNFLNDVAVTGRVIGLTPESAAQAPADCTPNKEGRIYFNTTNNRLTVCALGSWHALKMCNEKCPAKETVVCGAAVSTECGDDCNTTGTGLNSVQCAAAGANTLCGVDVKDDCSNPCGTKGIKLDPTSCANPTQVTCGVVVTDACGNGCGTTGSQCAFGTCKENACTVYGSKDLPGKSCQDILDNLLPTPASGTFYITTSQGAEKVYCDMTTDNGGWTLVMRVSKNDSGIDFTHDGAGWTVGSYKSLDETSLTSSSGTVDYVSQAYGEINVSDMMVRESLTSATHAVLTKDNFLKGNKTLKSVLEKPIIKSGQACSSNLAYLGNSPKHESYDDLVLSGDENGDTEPGKITLRTGCGGDAETLQLGYTRDGHGDNEVYTQGNHWPGLQAVYILVR